MKSLTKKVLSSLLAATTLVGMLAACGGGGSSAAPSSSEAPQSESQPASESETPSSETEAPDFSGQELIVYNTSKEEEMVILLERFEAETGVHGETVRLSAGEALGRISVERENPKANVWYGGGIDSYIQAREDGLLEAYVSPSSATIPDSYKDPDGYFTGQYLTYLVIAYNKTLLEEKGVNPPTSWQDLLDPAYEGQITIANPGSSGTAYTFLSTMMQLYGEEEGMAYMKALHPNIKSYEKSGSAPSRLAAQGEAMIAITYLHDALSYQEQGFVDLIPVIPTEGTGYEIGCTALIKGGPDQDVAKAFIDFCLRPENQIIQDEVGYYAGRTQPEAELSQHIKDLGEINLIDYDFAWSGANRARLVEEWSAMVGE